MSKGLDLTSLGPDNNSKPSPAVLFLYDFDDTIYPRSNPTTQKEDLDSFQNTVFELLSRSQDKGKVYIITNAKEAWVKDTIRRYIPKLDALAHELIIISARDLFGHENAEVNIQDLIRWKTLAICEVLSLERAKMAISAEVHVISIGDSLIERSAAIAATQADAHAVCKTIKLSGQPTINLLKKELEMLTKQLDYVTKCDSRLDLMITPVYHLQK